MEGWFVGGTRVLPITESRLFCEVNHFQSHPILSLQAAKMGLRRFLQNGQGNNFNFFLKILIVKKLVSLNRTTFEIFVCYGFQVEPRSGPPNACFWVFTWWIWNIFYSSIDFYRLNEFACQWDWKKHNSLLRFLIKISFRASILSINRKSLLRYLSCKKLYRSVQQILSTLKYFVPFAFFIHLVSPENRLVQELSFEIVN